MAPLRAQWAVYNHFKWVMHAKPYCRQPGRSGEAFYEPAQADLKIDTNITVENRHSSTPRHKYSPAGIGKLYLSDYYHMTSAATAGGATRRGSRRPDFWGSNNQGATVLN